MKKLRQILHQKSFRISLALCSMVAMLSMAIGASETPTTSDTVITAFGTGFQSIASDAMKMIALIVPIALGIAGVIFLARKGMSWFKSLAK